MLKELTFDATNRKSSVDHISRAMCKPTDRSGDSASNMQKQIVTTHHTVAFGSPFSFEMYVCSCGIAEVHRCQGNGKLPPETFRLVGPNISKHLTAGMRSEAEV